MRERKWPGWRLLLLKISLPERFMIRDARQSLPRLGGTSVCAVLVAAVAIVSGPSTALGGIVCDQLWGELSQDEKGRFAALADKKALAKAPAEVREALEACLVERRAELIRGLDNACGGPGKVKEFVRVLEGYSSTCVGLTARDDAPRPPVGARERVPPRGTEAPDVAQAQAPPTARLSERVDRLEVEVRWMTLRPGMTVDEVRARLGEPGRIEEKSLDTFWYYDTQLGAGTVKFQSDGMTVAEWTRPSE